MIKKRISLFEDCVLIEGLILGNGNVLDDCRQVVAEVVEDGTDGGLYFFPGVS